MKKLILTLSIVIITLIAIIIAGNNSYSNWEIKNNNKTEISWVQFEWTNEIISGKYFEKTSINVPCKIEGYKTIFTFQLDIGAEYTGIYENTFRSLDILNQISENKLKKLKSPLQFWNTDKFINNFDLQFGKYSVLNKIGFVYENHGEKLIKVNKNDTIHLGTIGRDLFKNKVLIIDYPNERFAISDKIPEEYNRNLTDIEIDPTGRIILPMKIRNQNYKITFDTGSSIFPIITEAKNISKFSSLPDIDTITISSWGKKHDVTGKLITDTFKIAGQKYCNVKVYANHSGLGIDDLTDGMTGNALYWDKTILIDFKNKKMGIY